MSSILAIDYGIKRIGFAISDEERKFAFPHSVMQNKNEKFVIEEIKKIVTEKDIDLILIGMPYNMDNTKGEMALKVEKFAFGLKEKINVKVEFVDERLTSFIAEENLKESNLSGKKLKKYVDSEAARLILENYISQAIN